MPRETIRITKDQRDALYEQVRNHFAAVGDLWIALEANKDYATAERLATEFSLDFRLMADLGWNPEDAREQVALTMPPHDLTEVAERLRGEARGGLAGAEQRAYEDEERFAEGLRAACRTCDAILLAIARSEEGEADVSCA